MKYSRELKIKSFILTVDQLSGFCKDLFSTIDFDQEESGYKPQLELETFNEENLKFRDDIDDFISKVKSNINRLSGVNMHYYGGKIEFRIDLRTYSSLSYSTIRVESEKKEKMLLVIDEIEKTFSNKTWNFLADKIVPLAVPVFVVGMIVKYKTYFRTLDDVTLEIILYGSLALAFFTSLKISKYYPEIVITDGNNKSGRVFKSDILYLLIAVLVLPFLGELIF